ncbi:uncharacterized protein LOC129589629 [Paramacrobiotus metropolitanus]|uniref:uncharacterized protein LOC129589629 n=1 Tax=Paramacrobiotus metropolitanus TaxID=2943436 RepID=UPI002445B82E|nr:uncharacterized protein LOC129589629 [Paramacrobiotus metropolitanus]
MVHIRDRIAQDQDNISVASLHLPPPRNDVVHWRILGYARKFSNFSRWEKGILGSATLCLAASIALTFERIHNLSPSRCRDNSTGLLTNVSNDYLEHLDKQCSAEYTFAWLTVIHCLFSLFYVWHGLFWARWYELIVFGCSTVLRLAYTAADFHELINHTHPADAVHQYIFAIKLTRLILLVPTVLTALIGCFVAYSNLKLGWIICEFPPQNCDERIRDDCKRIFLTRSLRTFSTQFQVTLIMLIMCHPEEFHLSTLEWVIVAFGIVFVLGWFFAVTFSLMWQDKYLAGVASGSVLAEFFYICYKFYDSDTALRTDNGYFSTRSLHIAVFAIGGAAMAARLVTTGCLYWTASRTFGNGLPWHKKVYPGSGSCDNEVEDGKPHNSQGIPPVDRDTSLPINDCRNSGAFPNYGATIPYGRIN